MSEKAIEILKFHKLSITKPRQLILDSFLHADQALDVRYFLDAFPETVNTITIYRTLSLFAKKKIIYRVPSMDRFGRYLLQFVEPVPVPAIVNHSSFICVRCKKVTPVNTTMAPVVELPKGFLKDTLEVVISGLCNSCTE